MNQSPQPTDRVIRVFISSTFLDMQEERDVLIKKIFPQLRKMCEERAVTLTEVDLRWGITDEQKAEGKVLPLCLEEIQRCRPYFIGLLGERYGSLPSEIPSDLIERQPWLVQHRDKSITALEIIHGVLRDQEMHGHAYFHFRDPRFVESIPPDKRRNFTAENALSAQKLNQLKNEIRRARDELVCELRENYATPEELGERILEDFTKLIDRLYPKDQTPDLLNQEAVRHEAYARGRRLAFVGREELLKRLNGHCTAPSKPLVLTGESGCGKSALLAEWAARWRKDHPEDLIIQHYIGSTPDSADWQGLVRRILSELKRAFTITDEIPVEPDALRGALNDWTVKAAGSRQVVFVLDALNQLAEDGAARQLGWLPVVFPTSFRVLVSALPGESLDSLRKRDWPELNVPLFAQSDIAPAALAYFKIFSKTPPPDIVAKLESTPAACNALYLRAVLVELRQFGRHEEIKAKAADYLSAPNLPELFNRILTRWHEDFGKDPEYPDLVRHSLCLIACARFGLSEAELLELLGKKNANGEIEPMPRRPRTPFYLAVESALALRAGLLNFGHDHLRAIVHSRYLSNNAIARNCHLRIGAYFWSDQRSRWWTAAWGSPAVNRVLDEVPWQLAETQSWEMLCSLLSHLPFLSAAYDRAPLDVRRYWVRLEKGSQFRMLEVYRGVLEAPEENHEHLRALTKLLTATGHVLEASKLLSWQIAKLRSDGKPDALVAPILDLAADYFELGEFRRALPYLEEAEQICRISSSDESLGQVFGEQALMYHRIGNLDRALELLTQQEDISNRTGAKHALAACLANQASIHLEKGDSLGALTLDRRVEELRRELGDLHGLADSLNNQALAHCSLKEWAKARSLIAKQQKLCRVIGHLGGLADGLSVSAAIEYENGRKARSKRYLTLAATLNGSLERKFKLAANLMSIARIFEDEERTEDAADALGESLRYFAEVQDPEYVAAVGLRHAIALSTLQRHEEALSTLDLAIRLNSTSDMIGVSLQAVRAQVLLALNKSEAALDSLDAIIGMPLLLLPEARGLKGRTLALRSKTLRELGRIDESLAVIQEAEDCLEADTARDLLVEALIIHARILIFDLKTPAVAVSVLERARAIAVAGGLANGLERIEYLIDRVNQQTGGRLRDDGGQLRSHDGLP